MELTTLLKKHYTKDHLAHYLKNNLINEQEAIFIKSLHLIDDLNSINRKKALDRFKGIEERLSKALSSKFDKDTRNMAKYRKPGPILF